MLDTVGNKADRSIRHREHDAASMVSAKAALLGPARLRDAAARRACSGVLPIPIQLYTGDCPITVAGPSRTITIFWRRLADHERTARPIRNIFEFDTTLYIRIAPKNPKTIVARLVTRDSWRVRPKPGRL